MLRISIAVLFRCLKQWPVFFSLKLAWFSCAKKQQLVFVVPSARNHTKMLISLKIQRNVDFPQLVSCKMLISHQKQLNVDFSSTDFTDSQVSHRSLSCSWVFPLTLDRFTCFVSRHNNRCKQFVPRFPLFYASFLWLTCNRKTGKTLGFDFDFVHYKHSFCLFSVQQINF